MTAHQKTVQIANRRGLHARAAAKFVKTVEQFDAEVKVAKDDMEVGGTSIMGLLMLSASKGTAIRISAGGAQGAEAVAELAALVERKFDEDE
ncbi:MAG TPA: HPr family phosphocarrier protein [Patescibacteria group bacterium]|nr:HPr family phosphocarrier protein [Patescibacteria group bacterium]